MLLAYLLGEKRGLLVALRRDGLTAHRGEPSAVVFPTSTAEVQAIVRACRRAGVPFVPRGAGTGLSGGALPSERAVIIECSRMNRIRELDLENRIAVIEPGMVNADLSKAVAEHGLFYAPDPSSQQACTLGGNVAENSGGPHTLKYGTTTNHVLALEMVLPDGELAQLGNLCPDTAEEAKGLLPSLHNKLDDGELDEILKDMHSKKTFQ